MSKENTTQLITQKIAAWEVMKARKLNMITSGCALIGIILGFVTSGYIQLGSLALGLGSCGYGLGMSWKDYKELGIKYGYITLPPEQNGTKSESR